MASEAAAKSKIAKTDANFIVEASFLLRLFDSKIVKVMIRVKILVIS